MTILNGIVKYKIRENNSVYFYKYWQSRNAHGNATTCFHKNLRRNNIFHQRYLPKIHSNVATLNLCVVASIVALAFLSLIPQQSAYSSTFSFLCLSVETKVLVLYAAPPELLDKLHGDTSRTWRIKAESGGHFGLGPVGGVNGPEWYSAGANEKSTTGMYDDRYIFSADGSFQHQTSGTVFGRVGLIDELGSSGGTQDGDDILNLPLADYSGQWTISAPGGVETLTLSGTGFIGYYIGGNHQYKIENRANPNELTIRSTDGNGALDWWFMITSE